MKKTLILLAMALAALPFAADAKGFADYHTETLKLLSKLFDVSINTLLGSPRQLICQCCGMPLDDSVTSRDTDGSFNEDYCKWCYTDGKFVYTSLGQLVDFLVEHFSSEQFPPEQARAYYEANLPKLKHWSK